MAAKERVEREAARDQADEHQKEPEWRDVKSEVAKTLIDAMRKGETPWQKPWSSTAMRPRNPVTGHPYRGVNRVLLSLAGAGAANGLWVTYRQAQAQGWQVRMGEKGTMIVKVVDLEQERQQRVGGSGDGAGRGQSGRDDSKPVDVRNRFILRRYFVFGAHQIEGMPELEQPGDLDFRPVEKAEAMLIAMQERTGLKLVHGGAKAFYNPVLDEIRLPPPKKFHSVYDYYATALHEAGHATLHEKRMNRREALGRTWGDEAYALEELRAEIASAVLAAEVGIAMTDSQREKHMKNHGAYLNSWIKALERQPLEIMAAVRDAERMADYIRGLERQANAIQEHREWVAEYDAAPTR